MEEDTTKGTPPNTELEKLLAPKIDAILETNRQIIERLDMLVEQRNAAHLAPKE